MKQLTIFCSRDLEDRVITALDTAGIEGFARMSDVTGNKFLSKGQVPRTMAWDSLCIIVPADTDERVDEVVGILKQYAGKCDIEPCLRMVVSSVEKAY